MNNIERRPNDSRGPRPAPENPERAKLFSDDVAAVPPDARNQFAIAAPRFRGAAVPKCSKPTG